MRYGAFKLNSVCLAAFLTFELKTTAYFSKVFVIFRLFLFVFLLEYLLPHKERRD